jgi:hypothetical protein
MYSYNVSLLHQDSTTLTHDILWTATECTILRPSEIFKKFSWFYHTIFKVLTTQILYPKCSILHPSELEKKDPPPPTAFSPERVGMYMYVKQVDQIS